MDAILTGPHLKSRVIICILTNVIVPKLEYAGASMGRERKVRKQLQTVQMPAATKILGCSSTTRNTVLRAEPGMYPLKTSK